MWGVYHNLPTSCALLDFRAACGAVEKEHPPNIRGNYSSSLYGFLLWLNSTTKAVLSRFPSPIRLMYTTIYTKAPEGT